MRLRARPRQRRGAAPELPVRRPRQRVPAAGLRDEPGPAARRAGGCRDTRHAGRAPAPGGRVMLRGTQTPEALTLAPPLVPLPSQSVVLRQSVRMLLPSAILFRCIVHIVRRRLTPPLHRPHLVAW